MIRRYLLAPLLLLFVATVSANPQSPAPAASAPGSAKDTLSAAVCPVVYPLDDAPGTRGYHYIFYGNAFFINRDGYLLTAAHVLSELQNGGQPTILLRTASSPPRLVKVTVVAVDAEHDVAILRATPNPFQGAYVVATLPLVESNPAKGQTIVVAALRPSHLKDPETFELPVMANYPAIILDFRAIPIGTSVGNSLTQKSPTDLFLFDHEVQRGQSGAPVTDAATHEVLGIVEGRWLHPSAATTANVRAKTGANASPTQGAAILIRYALALLRRNHIEWERAQTPQQ